MPFAAAPARQTAIDTARMAFAPTLDLLQPHSFLEPSILKMSRGHPWRLMIIMAHDISIKSGAIHSWSLLICVRYFLYLSQKHVAEMESELDIHPRLSGNNMNFNEIPLSVARSPHTGAHRNHSNHLNCWWLLKAPRWASDGGQLLQAKSLFNHEFINLGLICHIQAHQLRCEDVVHVGYSFQNTSMSKRQQGHVAIPKHVELYSSSPLFPLQL